MAKFQIDKSIEIKRPAEAVFQYLTDIAQTETWRANVSVQDYSGDPFAVGSSWKDVTSMFGRDMVATIEVTAIDDGRGYTMKQKTDGFSGHATWTIVPGPADSSTVTLASDGETSGWFAALASGLLQREAGRRMGADLNRLKKALESA